jgi:hypothetical protein
LDINSDTSYISDATLNHTHYYCSRCKALHIRGIEGHSVMKTGWTVLNKKTKINVGSCK